MALEFREEATPTHEEVLSALVHYRAMPGGAPPPIASLASPEEVAQYLEEAERGLAAIERAAVEQAFLQEPVPAPAAPLEADPRFPRLSPAVLAAIHEHGALLNNTGGNDPRDLLNDFLREGNRDLTVNIVRYLLGMAVHAQALLLVSLQEAGLLAPSTQAPSPEHAHDGEELLARITLSVDVVKGTDPGSSTPDGCDPPHDYVCVRSAEALASQAFAPTGILSVLDEGFFEDPDPDGALIAAVRDGLSELAPRRP